ncbi:MAG: cupin domain-containing protein [Acidobacteria bacterium]|nr:cupin domain-containing protein [Acidobacteriota bacterium]
MKDVFRDTAAATLFSTAKMNKVSLFASPRMFCDIYCLEPGQEQRPHHHAGNDKVYYALTGTCRVTIGGQTQQLRPGHVAIAPAGSKHGVRNDSAQRATLLVIMAPQPG